MAGRCGRDPPSPPFLSQPASAAALILCTYPDSDFAHNIRLFSLKDLHCFVSRHLNLTCSSGSVRLRRGLMFASLLSTMSHRERKKPSFAPVEHYQAPTRISRRGIRLGNTILGPSSRLFSACPLGELDTIHTILVGAGENKGSGQRPFETCPSQEHPVRRTAGIVR